MTLVPDGHDQITSNHGWDTKTHLNFLTDVTARFREAGIRVSIFVNADEEMVEYAARTGADRIELYTEPYATDMAAAIAVPEGSPEGKALRTAAIAPFIRAAKAAKALGLGLNAGHDLSLQNLAYFHQQIPWTDEVSIGHALICDALYLGLEETIKRYLAQLQ